VIAMARKPLPNRRAGYRQKLSIGGQKFHLGTGEYPDGTLGEIFIDASRTGMFVRAMLHAFAISVSRGLQYGVPLEDYVESFKEFHFQPCGEVKGDSRIPEADSILDLVFRELELTYIKKEMPAQPVSEETESN